MTADVGAVLLLATLGANLPFVNDRVFAVGPARTPKSMAWRLVELLAFGLAVLGVGLAVEAGIGQRHAQGWEFYVAAACLFLTLAFPGFVWRYLRRRHG